MSANTGVKILTFPCKICTPSSRASLDLSCLENLSLSRGHYPTLLPKVLVREGVFTNREVQEGPSERCAESAGWK